jgi:hypothetical protein
MDRTKASGRSSSGSSTRPYTDRRGIDGPGTASAEETFSPFSESDADERTAAIAILKEIGQEFTRLRKSNRTAAWGALQERLMEHLHMLVPNVVTLKDFMGLNIDIESFIKSDTGTTTKEPLEVIREFLAGGETLTTSSNKQVH